MMHAPPIAMTSFLFLTALIFLAPFTSAQLPFCPTSECPASTTALNFYGDPSCITLLQKGAPCTPPTPSNPAICTSGLTCNALGFCDDASKGDSCTDDSSVCRRGLSCRGLDRLYTTLLGLRRLPRSPSSAVFEIPSRIRVCSQVGIPEGGYCTVGALETRNVSFPGSWEAEAGQADSVAHNIAALDICAAGLVCSDGGVCVPGAFYQFNERKLRDVTFAEADVQDAYVPLGAFCDGVEAVCPGITFAWLSAVRWAREVPAECVDNVCVSVDPEYPVGTSCAGGCGKSLVCGENGTCVDARPWIFDTIPSPGNSASESVTLQLGSKCGRGQGECGDGLTCDGPYAPDLSQECTEGAECQSFHDDRRCLQRVTEGERCGIAEGKICGPPLVPGMGPGPLIWCAYGTCKTNQAFRVAKTSFNADIVSSAWHNKQNVGIALQAQLCGGPPSKNAFGCP